MAQRDTGLKKTTANLDVIIYYREKLAQCVNCLRNKCEGCSEEKAVEICKGFNSCKETGMVNFIINFSSYLKSK